MPWTEQNSEKRIREHIQNAPVVDENVTLAESRARMKSELLKARAVGRFPNSRAVVVEGAHLYGQLLDFENMVADQNKNETETTHRRILEFLHIHYQVWDSIVDGDNALTVDFHGPRLHAVVMSPAGNKYEQVRKAVALAEKLTEAAKRVSAAFGFPSRIRFGIDHGLCIAMTTGRSHDTDTLFLGKPANHAAKLAAAETVEGIHLTPEADAILERRQPQPNVRSILAKADTVRSAAQSYSFSKIRSSAESIALAPNKRPNFVFRRAKPPLASIKFAELMPSNTVRMGMVSLFGDIDGYTAFVDEAIRKGGSAIKTAVIALHAIREELNDVLKLDHGGKRVRFIGDCIHGVLAENEQRDSPEESVSLGSVCAAAMRSSFLICQRLIPGIESLDLAVGIEYGPIPLTRLGLPGEESIRCAAGRAVIESEREQQRVARGGVRLGEVARQFAKPIVLKLFGNASRIPEYDDAINLLGSGVSRVTAIVREDPSARSYFDGRSK